METTTGTQSAGASASRINGYFEAFSARFPNVFGRNVTPSTPEAKIAEATTKVLLESVAEKMDRRTLKNCASIVTKAGLVGGATFLTGPAGGIAAACIVHQYGQKGEEMVSGLVNYFSNTRLTDIPVNRSQSNEVDEESSEAGNENDQSMRSDDEMVEVEPVTSEQDETSIEEKVARLVEERQGDMEQAIAKEMRENLEKEYQEKLQSRQAEVEAAQLEMQQRIEMETQAQLQLQQQLQQQQIDYEKTIAELMAQTQKPESTSTAVVPQDEPSTSAKSSAKTKTVRKAKQALKEKGVKEAKKVIEQSITLVETQTTPEGSVRKTTRIKKPKQIMNL